MLYRDKMPPSKSQRRVALALSWAAFIITLFASGCELLSGGEDEFDVPPERLMTMTAVYAETDSGGAPVQRIILLDYDDPSNYNVVTENDHASVQPLFSPSKQQIVFQDRSTGFVHGPQFIHYTLATGEVEPLVMYFPSGAELQIAGLAGSAVWHADEEGFYFTNPSQSFSARQDLLFYRFAERRYEVIHDAGGQTVIPYTMKGQDTLVVFSGEQNYAGQGPLGYYFMDLEGNYLGLVDNPRLEYVNRDGVIKKGSLSPEWSDEVELFAVAYHDSTFEGYKIVVTDLNGSYWRELTSGEHIDDHPRWGPGGRTILFDRRPPLSGYFTDYRLMEVDLGTGEVREFAKPSAFGAVALRFPDY